MSVSPWRPRPARWFELLLAREDLTLALECLARTGTVELETHSEAGARNTLPDLRGRLDEFARLAQRYSTYWPPISQHPARLPAQPHETFDRALDRLREWAHASDSPVQRLETLASEQADLMLADEFLEALATRPVNPMLLGGAGPVVAARAIALPRRARLQSIPGGVMTLAATGREHEFLLAVGTPEEVAQLEQGAAGLKGRRVPLPEGLGESPATSRGILAKRYHELQQERTQLLEIVGREAERCRLSDALADIARLEWFVTHVDALSVTESFAWITGWTSESRPAPLEGALKECGVRGLLRFPAPPVESKPPLILENPAWARPFELFARLLGTPGTSEADPSRVLAVAVPLMFGYMFGDVGQGLVLALSGVIVARRSPMARLLIVGGISSALFGLLFGSVFSRTDIIHAMWIHPLEHPITLLAVPLAGGVVLLSIGILLNGLEAAWRGEAWLWWRQEAGLLPLYLGLVIVFVNPVGAYMALFGLAWYVVGMIRRRSSPAADIGHLMETSFQLAINTLSFARVGAFALAHAGLSSAVVALADTATAMPVRLLIMVLGNAVVIILEGLVVSIQVTRLVLFEFFIRFLRGEGRTFRPLGAPPETPAEQEKRKHR